MAFSCNALQLNDHIILNVCKRARVYVCVCAHHFNTATNSIINKIESRISCFILFGLTNAAFTPAI